MTLVPIRLQPGINVQSTPLLNNGGWSASQNIRFFQGLPQKDGGFVKFTQALPDAGVPRQLRAWTALSGISFLAIAGRLRLNIFAAEQVIDVTPFTITSLPPLNLSITAGSMTVVVHDAISPAPAVGENVEVQEPVSIGNIVLQGPYIITAVGANQYSITAQVTATSTVSGGNVRQFTTMIGQNTVLVFLPNHGLYTGQTVTFVDPTVVGGVLLHNNYSAMVVDQNNFTIVASTPATFSTMVSENGGALRVTFTAPPTGGSQVNFRNTVSTLANWGEFLFWNPRGGPTYVWMPALGFTPANVATDIATAPQSSLFIFVATQQQILFCCGTVNPATGLIDPMLLTWSDVGDYTDFIPTLSNQAGSFRLTAGSTLVGGLALAGGNLLWTNTALYSAQYLGFPLIWGFQPIGINCGLIGPHAFGTLGENIFWMSQQQFYQLAGGTPQVLRCTVWDLVFKNLDPNQTDFIVCETNSFFNEVSWEVPQIDGTTTRARVDVNDGLWNVSILPSGAFLPPTAWIDQSVFGPPLSADSTGAIWQHEVGKDAGTEPLLWELETGEIMISEGDDITFVREFLPDFKFTESGQSGPGVVEILIFLRQDSQEPPSVKGPFPITSTTRSVPVHGRGRTMSWRYRGRDLGSWVRLGNPRIRSQPDGRA